MGSRQDDAIGCQQRDAFGMKVLVGDDVIVMAYRLEPVGDVGVRIEGPEFGPDAAAPPRELRSHV